MVSTLRVGCCDLIFQISRQAFGLNFTFLKSNVLYLYLCYHLMSFQKFYNFNNYKSKITDDLISVIQTIKSSERKVLVCLPDKR